MYGNLKASNLEIEDAAKQANALEFIVKNDEVKEDLSNAFSNDAAELKQALLDHKTEMLTEIGDQEEYDDLIKNLEKIAANDLNQGKFEQVTDLVDTRTDSEKNPDLTSKCELAAGFEI